MQTFTCGAS